MKHVIIVVLAIGLLAGCSSSSGPGASEEFEIHQVLLEDGRILECISSSTYGGSGVLDCNWDNPR